MGMNGFEGVVMGMSGTGGITVMVGLTFGMGMERVGTQHLHLDQHEPRRRWMEGV